MAARDSSATKGDSARRGPPTVANHFRVSMHLTEQLQLLLLYMTVCDCINHCINLELTVRADGKNEFINTPLHTVNSRLEIELYLWVLLFHM